MLYGRRRQTFRHSTLRNSHHETFSATHVLNQAHKVEPKIGSRVLDYTENGNPKVLILYNSICYLNLQ
jgi:hypothetical protein